MSEAISAGDSGSKVASGIPSTSGSDDVFDVMVGQPHAAASAAGRPKPSYRDG